MNIWLTAAAILIVAATMRMLWRSRKTSSTQQEPECRIAKVRGIAVCQKLAYHPNHVWLRKTDEKSAAVGVDDFARRLAGTITRVVLPLTGSKVHAGETCVKLITPSSEIPIVSPVTGEIIEINQDLAMSPELVVEDNYGDGWLFRLRSWRLSDQEAELLHGGKVHQWMEETVETFIRSVSSVAGAVSQDGGHLAEDLSEPLDTQEWIQLVRKHLGTEPRLK